MTDFKKISSTFLLALVLLSCSQAGKEEQVVREVIRDTVIVYQEQIVQEPKATDTKAEPILTKEDKEVREMIERMNGSWQKLIDTGKEEEVLQYFAEAYIANQVSISADNSGGIQSFTNTDFPKYLKSVKKRKGYKYKFSDVRFLDVEIKDKTYFNTVFKSQLIETDGKGKQIVNSIIVTVTGKKVQGDWKIGNYSWVNFEYN